VEGGTGVEDHRDEGQKAETERYTGSLENLLYIDSKAMAEMIRQEKEEEQKKIEENRKVLREKLRRLGLGLLASLLCLWAESKFLPYLLFFLRHVFRAFFMMLSLFSRALSTMF